MSKINNTNIITGDRFAAVVHTASIHAAAAINHMKSACSEALLTGAFLFHLREHTKTNGGKDKEYSGFQAVLDACQIKSRTAYRWINAYENVCANTDQLPSDFDPFNQEFSSKQNWELHLAALNTHAQGMSIARLLIGHGTIEHGAHSDHSRLDYLHTLQEVSTAEGDDDSAALAEELLAKVENGTHTLIQALKIATGKAAQEKATANRNNVVYADIIAGKPCGLIPKSFTTIINGLSQWNTFSDATQSALCEEWKAVLAVIPSEFLKLIPRK